MPWTLWCSKCTEFFLWLRCEKLSNYSRQIKNLLITKLEETKFPKDHYAQGASIKNALMVGSPQQIIEKILYQHELFGHSRLILQLDSSGIPYKKVAGMVEMFATTIAPAVNKALKA